MDQKIISGEKHAGEDNHTTFNWQHVWKSVEQAGTQAGNAIKKQASQIDTRELADKAKHVAKEGLNVARGKSENTQANQFSDAAAKLVPGAGLIRQGAEIAHETGAEGKILDGKKGPLHAPSESTMKKASKEAIGSAIPLPGGGLLANEVLNRSGIKDRVIDGAFDAAKNHGKTTEIQEHKKPMRGEPHAKAAAKELDFPPKVVIDDKKDNFVDGAKDKVSKLFHSLHTPDVIDVKKN